jgi:hypothetical protein
MKMTTPVFTEQIDQFSSSGVKIQIVLPLQSSLSELPVPLSGQVKVQQVEGRAVAAIRFNGKPTEDLVQEKAKILTEELAKDGLRQKGGILLARYNDPGRTFPLFMVHLIILPAAEFFNRNVTSNLLWKSGKSNDPYIVKATAKKVLTRLHLLSIFCLDNVHVQKNEVLACLEDFELD